MIIDSNIFLMKRNNAYRSTKAHKTDRKSFFLPRLRRRHYPLVRLAEAVTAINENDPLFVCALNCEPVPTYDNGPVDIVTGHHAL